MLRAANLAKKQDLQQQSLQFVTVTKTGLETGCKQRSGGGKQSNNLNAILNTVNINMDILTLKTEQSVIK